MFKLLTPILIFIAAIGCSPYKSYLRTIDTQIEQSNDPVELNQIAVELANKFGNAPKSQVEGSFSGPKEAYLRLHRKAVLKRDKLKQLEKLEKARLEVKKARLELEDNFKNLKNKKFDEVIAKLNVIPSESVAVSADAFAHKFRIECETEFDYGNPNQNDYYELMLFVDPNGVIYQVVYELKTTFKHNYKPE